MSRISQYIALAGTITPKRGVLLLLIGLMLIENGLALCTPWIAGQLTNTILTDSSDSIFSYQQILGIWFLIIIVQTIFGYFHGVLSSTTSERMLTRMRNRIYTHLQSLPLSFHNERKHGETLALITNESAIISFFVTGTLISILPQLLTAAGAVLCVALISPLIASLITFLVPIFFIAIKLLGRQIRPISKKLMDQYAATFSLAEENLGALALIKASNRERHENQRFTASNERLFNLNAQYIREQGRLAPVIKFLATSIVLLILFLAGEHIASGAISTGEIVTVVMYGMLLTQPISRLADIYGQIQRTRSAADKLLDVLHLAPEDLDGGPPLQTVDGTISFDRVCFSYPGRTTIINDFSLSISKGELIAIVGENGSGKSTIAHLLMRLYSPDKGTITIDGTDISSVSLNSLRRQIGYVQQNVMLFNTTVKDNIRFARPDASDEEILKAAHASHSSKFISELPGGFDTIIGDHGVKLSGGQKQRLSLARALLMNSPILILDEATAMFDPEGEIAFLQENRPAFQQKTVIIITHRPASLQLADRIIHIDKGRLVHIEEPALAKNSCHSYNLQDSYLPSQSAQPNFS
ncbi:ABC transporter ATP-binding protein [Desulfosediminicola ganghwensis]|uniref:ABC transporter ATP-binding protein n=1 Tax=Desulfosediminicola ganghwensis TaxID=2569540 RepID=UPI0010AC87D2|nr:ABC transporter ATP-binding protein [Desulfosediminicola ganghwensis]